MDWSKVTKEHVDKAIQKYIEEQPEHPEPRSYYLLYEGQKLPSKFIRGMAYSIATGEPINLNFKGGVETVSFFKKYGYEVKKDADLTGVFDSWTIVDENTAVKKKTDIDYIGVLNYLRDNMEIPYSNPEAPGIESQEKQRLLEVKEKGQAAVAEMKKMAEAFSKKFKLDKCLPMSWLDGSNTKTRRYLWAQLKYSDYADNPTSISIFVEKNGETLTRYRISLEIKNDGTDKATMAKYHTHLDIPLNKAAGLVYVSGSNEWGHPTVLSESQDEIKQEVVDGKLRKVQVSRYVERKPDETNEYFHSEVTKAIAALLPYYDHILGKEPSQDMDTSTDKGTNTQNTVTKEFDKNMILYGPPGTGKTYNTVSYAVAIIEDEPLSKIKAEYDADPESVKDRYDKYVKAGQIEFTTFHQSYGYEDFIEGIKPITENGKITYEVEPGVFKRFCERAEKKEVTSENFKLDDDATIWKVTIKDGSNNPIKKDCFANGRVRIGWDKEVNEADDNGKRCVSALMSEMQEGDIILSFKDRRTVDGIGIVNSTGYEWLSDEDDYCHSRGVNWLATNISEDIYELNGDHFLNRPTVHKVGRMHPSDLVNVIKKYNTDFADTVVKENTKRYVFIIDEINRGNISKIFGELITLIESTKRKGMPEQMTARLPYSGDDAEAFGVPQNVFILGTMNTADRSIALMDTALRRRFQFVEMMPDPDVLRKIGADKVVDGSEELDVAAMLETINERITFLYDREHTIGHAFFTGLADDPSLNKLASIFSKSVIPLLQEYFYEDYQKIQLVLGDNGKTEESHKFIKDTKVVAKSIFKGSVDDIIDLPEKKYEVNKGAFKSIQSYKEIM